MADGHRGPSIPKRTNTKPTYGTSVTTLFGTTEQPKKYGPFMSSYQNRGQVDSRQRLPIWEASSFDHLTKHAPNTAPFVHTDTSMKE